MMIDESMVTRKSWEEFRQNGLLWFTNLILHMFGWSIVVKQDNNIIVDIYPARVKYRGFSEKTNTEGYKKSFGLHITKKFHIKNRIYGKKQNDSEMPYLRDESFRYVLGRLFE